MKKSVEPEVAAIPDPVSRFEAAMKELDALVQTLERGELSLDASLKAYEQGMKLSEECRAALETAELKIKTLSNKPSANS